MTQSWLITGGSRQEKQKEAEKVWSQSFPGEKYPVFDLLTIGGDPIKIAQIREAEQFLSTKAASAAAKVILVERAEKMTTSAANAFLKTLEEPPGRSLIFLLTDNPYDLSETVLSRCQTVRLINKVDLNGEYDSEAEECANQLIKGGFGDRLAIFSERRKNKEIFLEFIRKQIVTWRRIYLRSVSEDTSKTKLLGRGIKVWLAAERLAAANVNLKLVEGWIALTLPGVFEGKKNF